MWTLAYGHHRDRSPTHGYKPTREAAIAGKSWHTAPGVAEALRTLAWIMTRAACSRTGEKAAAPNTSNSNH